MGVIPRKVGELFAITSDRATDGIAVRAAPKSLSNVFQVWTGDRWSQTSEEAKLFTTMDDAEEYVRANYTKVMAP